MNGSKLSLARLEESISRLKDNIARDASSLEQARKLLAEVADGVPDLHGIKQWLGVYGWPDIDDDDALPAARKLMLEIANRKVESPLAEAEKWLIKYKQNGS